MSLPCDDVGAGPALVLLHAGVADRTMWEEHLRPLADANYRVIAPDLPGFGEAIPSGILDPWGEVLETMDALGVERATLVGNSFGGAVALGVAVAAPERVAALVVVSAPPPGLTPSDELTAAWDAEESALERGDIDAAISAVLDAWVVADAPAGLRDRVARMQRRTIELDLAAGELTQAEDPLERDHGALGRLALPALVAAGELDMPDFLLGAESISRQLPDARHVVVSGVGHLLPLEQPAAFRELLLGFLREPAVVGRATSS
jgi:pimeloyl-ACP methyl ester carboxylesterase